ncbi:acyltransferase family protein [Dysgonomonas gadei]|uniref:Acyltransferase 3 domain-containing protein n=1 Tax=Dysgonomonas gadei ATCC BAA-286 TaxID=742766 RepID=F5J195_9BACT|nr:hypothetical protein HMPREF9455_03112 [Dysgonomonas gadei ATCC BAA-286]
MTQTTNYNPTFDFLKGIAILFVLLLHAIPKDILYQVGFLYHIGQAVPIFILIQGFHSMRKFDKFQWKSYYFESTKRLLMRIILPFVFIQIISILLLAFINDLDIISIIKGGGYGPGSYYPYIYIQAWLILPLICSVIQKYTPLKVLAIGIFISLLFEIICIVSSIPIYFYRLSVIRYVFLLFLGCYFFKYKMRPIFYILSVISIIFIYFDSVNFLSCFRIFYNGWNGYHWIMYFYTISFVSVLIFIYNKLKNGFTLPICYIGKCSYEVFLMQMFCFGFREHISKFVITIFPFLSNSFLLPIIMGLFIIILSITLGFSLKYYIKILDSKFLNSL